MLDWLEEEKQYVNKAVDNYLKEQSAMPLGFMISRKTLNNNIEEVKKEATDRYRFDKLMKYRGEIETERKRIDTVVEEINNKFNEYLNSVKNNVNKNIKPFKLDVKEYTNLDIIGSTTLLETVTIQCEPFRIAFVQEKLEKEVE